MNRHSQYGYYKWACTCLLMLHACLNGQTSLSCGRNYMMKQSSYRYLSTEEIILLTVDS